MSRNIKIKKLEPNEITDKFKIGLPFILSHPIGSKLRLDKLIGYEYNSNLNENTFVKSYECLIDMKMYGIIIGDAYKIDFSLELSKEIYKPNIFIRCLVDNKDCLIDYRKINLL
jgi:hypothetical protein